MDSIEETPRLGGESPLRVSVVITVKDDPEGERKLMEALEKQTVRPDEVIIVESSNRETPWHTPRSHPIFARRILSVGCSRGRGRNIGVKMARNEVIAVTDAGCRPHRDWLYKLYKCYKNYKKDNDNFFSVAIAGGYRAEARRQLQQIMAHFLVPMDYFEGSNRETPWHSPRSHPIFAGEYLPASRSIMFTKKAWEAVGGYPEEAVSGAEDLEFARRLSGHPEVKMVYCPQALVDWEPPATLGEFFRDIVKHTRGNVEVGYLPHLIKNFTVVLRWMVFLAFPWMIPIYLGIKIIKIINTIDGLRSHLAIRQGDTLNLPLLTPRIVLFIPMTQLVADGGVIWGLGRGIVHKFIRWLPIFVGRLGRLGNLGNLRI